jgi:hypothetical protein
MADGVLPILEIKSVGKTYQLKGQVIEALRGKT